MSVRSTTERFFPRIRIRIYEAGVCSISFGVLIVGLFGLFGAGTHKYAVLFDFQNVVGFVVEYGQFAWRRFF